MTGLRTLGLALSLLLPAAVRAQTIPAITPGVGGSPAFCLVEVPVEEVSKRRWINLAHVQYVETASTGVRLFFGGGNFGAGHETLIPASTPSEAQGVLDKLRRVAAGCTGSRSSLGTN